MKKYKIIIGLIISLLFVFSACDKIEEPYIAEGTSVWNGRKILIYDFTGHKCGNCPRAHKLIDSYKPIYGEAIVPIAIHGTFFAMPEDNADGKFNYDFRTPIGDILAGRDFSTDCYYGELFLPMGIVNNLAKESLLADVNWTEEVEKYISLFPEFELRIVNSYCTLGDNIIANINCEALIESDRNLHINAFVIEDKILQWQTDYTKDPSYIQNYEHNHVLRAGFIDAFGEIINQNNEKIKIGKTFNKVYSLKIEDDWNRENCSVVTFVYDSDTKEVLQAEMIKFSN